MFNSFYFYSKMSEKAEKCLKVLEPIQLDVKTFQDKQEFELFYNSHKEEFENSTTTKLNRMYKIPGYRITRVKEQLCLKKDYTKKDESSGTSQNFEERLQSLEDKFEKKLKDLEDKLGNNSDELLEKIQDNVSKLELRFNNFMTKIKKMENIINQQTESLNMILGNQTPGI